MCVCVVVTLLKATSKAMSCSNGECQQQQTHKARQRHWCCTNTNATQDTRHKQDTHKRTRQGTGLVGGILLSQERDLTYEQR